MVGSLRFPAGYGPVSIEGHLDVGAGPGSGAGDVQLRWGLKLLATGTGNAAAATRCPIPRAAIAAMRHRHRRVLHTLLCTPKYWAFRGGVRKAERPRPASAAFAGSNKAGISPLGVAIDFGALISMFACVLACTTAAARCCCCAWLVSDCCLLLLERTSVKLWHARQRGGSDVGRVDVCGHDSDGSAGINRCGDLRSAGIDGGIRLPYGLRAEHAWRCRLRAARGTLFSHMPLPG